MTLSLESTVESMEADLFSLSNLLDLEDVADGAEILAHAAPRYFSAGSTLGGGVRIGDGAALVGCEVADDAEVGSSASLLLARIGARSVIGADSVIGVADPGAGHEIPADRPAVTHIGIGVRIGKGVTVRAGVRIGDGAVIPDHAVVARDVPCAK